MVVGFFSQMLGKIVSIDEDTIMNRPTKQFIHRYPPLDMTAPPKMTPRGSWSPSGDI